MRTGFGGSTFRYNSVSHFLSHTCVCVLCAGCSGKRKAVEFHRLSQFSDRLLHSDFFLLEETQRGRDQARKMAAREASAVESSQQRSGAVQQLREQVLQPRRRHTVKGSPARVCQCKPLLSEPGV